MSHMMMFTALPRGMRGSQLRFSVFISPRFNIGGTSTTLGNLLQAPNDWPSIAKRLSFGVFFTGALGRVIATPDPDSLPAYDSALWTRLFPAATPLGGYAQKQYNTGSLTSYGAQTVTSHVKNVYAQAALGSAARPIVTKSTNTTLTTSAKSVAAALKQTYAAGPAIDPRAKTSPSTLLSKAAVAQAVPSATGDSREFLRAAVYHNRGKWRERAGVPAASMAPALSAATAIQPPDFHQIVGQLGDHPAILRRLGLILDFVCTAPAGVSGTTSFYAMPMPDNALVFPAPLGSTNPLLMLGGSASAGIVHPFIRCTLTSTSFQAWTNSNEFDGTTLELNLTTGPFAVETLDVDHAVQEYSAFAEHANDSITQVSQSSDPNASVELCMPALHTAGFTIHHGDREAVVGQRFNRPFTFENDPNRLLFVAEEVMRGYRVEVQRTHDQVTGPWQSLCARTVSLDLNGQVVPPYTDKGFVKAASVAASSPDVDIFNVHESLFRWEGWSLTATRPGRVIQHAPETNGELPTVLTNSSPSGAVNAVATRIVPQPGTLPRLRFGSSYSFRVVPVDLAGNDMVSGGPSNVSLPIAFLRHDPISPPALVLQSAVTEGESVEHLVIRSNPYDSVPQDPNAYAAAMNLKKDASGNPIAMNPYSGSAVRHVAPPKTSQHMAELHGAFDALLTNPAHGYAVASKESGTFLDLDVIDTTGNVAGSSHTSRRIITPPAASMPDGSAPPNVDPKVGEPRVNVPRGDALAHGQYVTLSDDTANIVLPYLPDPNAAGVTLQVDPSTITAVPGVTLRTRTYAARNAGGGWPELGLVKLVVSHDDLVQVPTITGDDAHPSPTGALTVSLPAASNVTLQYSSSVVDPSIMALAPSSMTALVKGGGHTMVSPTRKLVLIHAVQKPAHPSLNDASFTFVQRGPGETTAPIQGYIDFADGKSSAKVDLVAAWNEYLDVPQVPGSADPVPDPSATPVPHTSIITSLTLAPSNVGPQLLSGARQAFGDTKHRTVRYQAIATTRFREYFPAAITADYTQITNASTELAINVLSTARPPAPKVLYVVPSFKWVQSAPTSRTRVGGGVRVYVDRGWYASGEDERLAVVHATSLAQAQRIPNLVSVWGDDPIWIQKNPVSPAGAIDASHFVPPPSSDSASSIQNVLLSETLAGNGNEVVNVLSFKPQFNKDRQLWYFDIELTTGKSYMPFLRLALARVQASSLVNTTTNLDLRLSPVIKAEFAQLAADRTATVAPNPDGTWGVTVSGVVGSNYDWDNVTNTGTRVGFDAASGRIVTAELQESSAARGDAVDWRRVSAPVALTPYVSQSGSGYLPVVSFQGNVALPTLTPATQHRIVVREYENFASDDEIGVKYLNAPLHYGAPEGSPAYGRRLVYVDAIAINV